MTSKSTWKAFERIVASYFGVKRTPLSGSCSGGTHSDTQHPYLFIEAKLKAKSAVHTLWNETVNKATIEAKIPVLALKLKGATGFLLVIHPDDLEEVGKLRTVARILEEWKV